jgi:YD repeat-containing protein
MKKMFLSCFALFVSVVLFGQKTDGERIDVTYRQFPQKPLETSVNDYKIKVFNAAGAPLPPMDVITRSLKLNGFVVSNDNPDVILALSIDEFKPYVQVLPKLTTGGPTMYVYKTIVNMKASIRFLTADTRYEYYKIDDFGTPLGYSAESQPVATEQEAKKMVDVDRSLLERASKQCMDQALSDIGSAINNYFGYAPRTDPFPVYSIKSKDFDYAEVDHAKDVYIQAMKQFSISGPTAENKKLLDEAVAIWTKNVAEYNPGDKKARISKKNILELYMNLTLANVWLNNFPDAKKYFALAVEEDGLNGVKMSVDRLLTSMAEGYRQNALREENKLSITRKESELYCAPEFILENHPFRIKYIEYYDNPKKIAYREVFEYDGNGLLKYVYKQKYDALNRKYYEGYDGIRIIYDSKAKVMSFYKDGSNIPVASQTFSDGHIILKAGKDKYNTPFNYTFAHDKIGRCVKSVNTSDRWTAVERFKYDNSNHVIEKMKTVLYKGEKDSIPDSKYLLSWNGNALRSIDVYRNVSHAKTLVQKSFTAEYNYDAVGNMVKISEGHSSQQYTYDAFGNFIECILRTDIDPLRWTYVWEAGSGNAPLYLEAFNNYNTLDPNVALQVY